MDFDVVAARQEMARAEAAARRNFALLARIREYLRTQQTDDNTPLSLERAVCHPLLGGILRRDARGDVPGPSFTVASLRRAAKAGELETFWHGRFQFVTPAALKAWIHRGNTGSLQRNPKPGPIDYQPPAQRTRYEKSLEEAAMDRVADAFAAVDQMVARNKTKKRAR